MTLNYGTRVEEKLREIISRRNQVWQKHDDARKQEKELQKFNHFHQKGVIEQSSIRQLSTTGQAPDELAAAVWQLKQEDEKIKNSEKNIQALNEQIAQVQKQFYIVIAVAISFVFIVLLALLKR